MDQSTSRIHKTKDALISPKASFSLFNKKLATISNKGSKSFAKSKQGAVLPINSSEQHLFPNKKFSFLPKTKPVPQINSPNLSHKLQTVLSARNFNNPEYKSTLTMRSYNSAASLNFSHRAQITSKIDVQYPISPKIALTQFVGELTEHERSEILEYSEIYYLGKLDLKNDGFDGDRNYGFDNEKSDYVLIKHDHIGYRYEIIKMLGKGSFGQVCLCFDHKRKENVAVKIIKNKKKFRHQASVEIRVLKTLVENDHNDDRNIVHIKNFFFFRNHVIMVFELLSMNLYDLLRVNRYQGFSISLIRKFTSQILVALNFAKSLGVIHCDLKPENVLLRSENSTLIKVIDFGSSCFHNEIVYTYIQSRFYRAPEIILGIDYNYAIDMWSLGCIIVELYTGEPLFPGETEHEQLLLIMEILGAPESSLLEQASKCNLFFYDSLAKPTKNGFYKEPQTRFLPEVLTNNSDPDFLDFIEKCLIIDPQKRMTPSLALEHQFISNNNGILKTKNIVRRKII